MQQRMYPLKCDRCGATDNTVFQHAGDVCLAMEKGGWQVIKAGNTFLTLCRKCKGVNDEKTIQVPRTTNRNGNKEQKHNDTVSVRNGKKSDGNSHSPRKRKTNADNNTKKHN